MPFSSTNNCHSIPKQKLIIRHAQSRDISELAATIVSSFYNYSGVLSWLHPFLQFTVGEDLRYRLRSSFPLYQCLVATLVDENEGSLIVGTVEISLKVSFWSSSSQYPYISNLAVKDSYRRQGIARQLLTKCEQLAHSWGYDAIQLHVLEHNKLAKQLYLNSGYQIVKKETYWDGLFNPNSTRLLLRKKICNVQIK